MSRSSSTHWIISALLVGIAIALIWLSTRFDYAIDVTANQRHGLSNQTILAVQSLNGPITLTAVIGPNQTQRDALRKLVSRYQKVNASISLDFVNPETDPERARQLNAAVGGELFVRGMGREQRLQSVTERALTGALRQLNRDGERRLAFITDHEERPLISDEANSLSQLAARLASIGFNSEPWSLVTNPRLTDDVDLVVIADPRRPYFPGEIAGLLEHVNRGGNLLWLIESELNKQTGSALTALGLELGVEPLPGLVIDTASQSANAGSPAFVILNAFTRHPVTEALTSPLLLPQAKALAVTPLAGQTLLPLLQTNEDSWTETGKLEGAIAFDEATDEHRGPLAIGITIEREINGRQQRIAVIGDADFATNQFIGNGANFAFGERLVLWLAGESDALSFVTKPAPDASLLLDSRSIVIITTTLLVALPVLLLIIAGFMLWRKRR